jgi:hypothetical protein
MRAWLNHAALNAGQGLRALIDLAQCLWFGALPPRWTGHSTEDVATLKRGRLGEWFAYGFGSTDDPPAHR